MGMDKNKNIAEYSADYRTVYKRAIPGKGPVRQKGKPALRPAAAMPENTAKREGTQPEKETEEADACENREEKGPVPNKGESRHGLFAGIALLLLALAGVVLIAMAAGVR
ncbi:MAG TPA: hypothetical protein DG942_03490 [Ruminococcaceae bacterium]|jgi:hypothetical protein|nr:hypothetical protein [Oscillospiraceae bacterium]